MNLASPPPQTRRSRRPGPDLSAGPAPASIRSCVRGVGAALPARVVTNEELAAKVETSDEWIVQRTGIRQRYIAGAGETTSTLATKAAEAALAAGVSCELIAAMQIVRRLERMGEDIGEENIEGFADLAACMDSEFAAIVDSIGATHAA